MPASTLTLRANRVVQSFMHVRLPKTDPAQRFRAAISGRLWARVEHSIVQNRRAKVVGPTQEGPERRFRQCQEPLDYPSRHGLFGLFAATWFGPLYGAWQRKALFGATSRQIAQNGQVLSRSRLGKLHYSAAFVVECHHFVIFFRQSPDSYKMSETRAAAATNMSY